MHIVINKGFTLIELVVTLSVGSILLAVAAPNYQVFVQNSRLSAQNNSFASALILAKSEAVKRSSPATVCPSTSGTACAGGTNWSNGWLVFADPDGDGVVDAGEQIIQVSPALTGGNTLSSGARTRVTFAPSGFTLGFADTFSSCDDRGATHSKALVLNNQGRLHTDTVGTGVCL